MNRTSKFHYMLLWVLPNAVLIFGFLAIKHTNMKLTLAGGGCHLTILFLWHKLSGNGTTVLFYTTSSSYNLQVPHLGHPHYPRNAVNSFRSHNYNNYYYSERDLSELQIRLVSIGRDAFHSQPSPSQSSKLSVKNA